MKRAMFAGSGGTTGSGVFETTVVVAGSSPAGSASYCNNGFRMSLGLWSGLGDLPVPIELRLDKVHGATSTVDLTWSGADPVFEVYRAFSPESVVLPGQLIAVTPLCDLADGQAATDLLFYSVIPSKGDTSNSLTQARGGQGQ